MRAASRFLPESLDVPPKSCRYNSLNFYVGGGA
jgi:hypothetical protein